MTDWVEKAKSRFKISAASEVDAYKKFLRSYKQAEENTRSKNRNQRGGLTKDWTCEQLSDKTVLVIGEDRIGDEVLTIGCLPDLVPKCKSVSWKCDPKLKVVFTRSFPDVAFVSADDQQSSVKGTIYSWELIERFRDDLCKFGWTESGHFTPYLKPAQPLRDDLRNRYDSGAKKLVGLAWRSERNGAALSDKICDLRDVPHWSTFFDKLKDKARFVSLQYGDTDDDIAFVRRKYGVEIYQDKNLDIFNDVDTAAAQVAAMDYVVSISTTAAHLAGALGVRGWVLLPAKPFAHWRAGIRISPWYPTLCPIKQPTAGNWKFVLENATEQLNQELAPT